MEPAEKFVAEIDGQNYQNKLAGKVAVWKENAIILLDPSAILYFSMVSKKVIVHTRDSTFESGSSLEELEERLYYWGFFRCHKSFLVNMNYVEKIVPWFNSTYIMKLAIETEQIPVSRYYAKRLRSLLDL